MADIEVYYFKGWDQVAGENPNSRRPGTLETITRVRGEVIRETRRLVDSSDIDGNGFLKDEKVALVSSPFKL